MAKKTEDQPATDTVEERAADTAATETKAGETSSEDAAPAAAEATGEDKSAGKKEDASVSDLSDLGKIAGDQPDADAAAMADAEAPVRTGPEAVLREKEVDAQGRSYATGRRKDAVARVWLKPGKGTITVNGKDQETYFARPTLRLILNQPFAITDRAGQYDIVATVTGGGLSGQAGAVKHGISQALSKFEPELRSTIKAAGFLTRDSRVVERKKYGRAKARRSFQFSKR